MAAARGRLHGGTGRPGDGRGQRGVALVLVMWIVALLAVMAGGASLEARRDGTLARYAVDRAQARELAKAGVYHAMAAMNHPQPDKRWVADGSRHQIEVAGHEVAVAVWDESGRVDLNTAQGPLLARVLKAAGAGRDRVDVLVDTLLDWRDPDDNHRPHGAEARAYRDAGRVYGPRNGEFASVDELRLVLGVDRELYRRLAPRVTVHSQAQGVNPRLAPRSVLLALPGASEALVDSYIRQREQAQPEQPIPPPPFGQGARLSQAQGVAYSVSSYVRLPSGVQVALRAVMTPGGEGEVPYSVVEWRWDAPTAAQ